MGTRRGTRRDLASGSGAKVNKDPLSLLRLGLPAIPKDLREAQVRGRASCFFFIKSLNEKWTHPW